MTTRPSLEVIEILTSNMSGRIVLGANCPALLADTMKPGKIKNKIGLANRLGKHLAPFLSPPSLIHSGFGKLGP